MSGLYYPQCRASLQVVFDGFGAGESAPLVIRDVKPISATVHLTPYKEADSWSLEFDAKALPFSPELIRAAAVEIYMFDALSTESGERYATEQNLIVAGLVDEAGLSLSDNGRRFTLDGKDYTDLLAYKPWDPRRRLSLGKPLDLLVQELVDEVTKPEEHGGRTLRVQFHSDKPAPAASSAFGPRTKKRGKTVREGRSYWDVIYELVDDYGFICHVRGWTLHIRDPQTLTEEDRGRIRAVAYGRNLESLTVSRKLGKERVPQIKVTSFDPVARRPVSATYPEKKDEVSVGIGTKRDEVVTYTVKRVTDPEALRRIARKRYESLARQEAVVKFATKDLTDLKGLNLLQIRAGDAMHVIFDPFNDEEMRRLEPPERHAYLKRLGYSDAVALVVAENYKMIKQFRAPFYVKSASLEWDVDNGLTVEGELVNFIMAARDA